LPTTPKKKKKKMVRHPAFKMHGKPMTEEMMQKEEEKQKKRDEKHTAAALAVRKKFASRICEQAETVRLAISDLIYIERIMRDEDSSLKYARDDIMTETVSYGEGDFLHEALDSIKEVVNKSSVEAGICLYGSDEEEEDCHDSSEEASDSEEKEDDGL
jgi:hypothetical protein